MNYDDLKRKRGVVPTWAEIRVVGNSRPVQLASIFPVIGYVILLSSSITDIFDGGIAKHSGSLFGQMWSLKLYFVYFGLTMLGAGSLVYQLRCPRIIRKHADSADFIRLDISHYSESYIQGLRSLLDMQFSKGPEVLSAYYAYSSAERVYSRVVAIILFGVGFLLLAIPSALSFIKVANAFIVRTV